MSKFDDLVNSILNESLMDAFKPKHSWLSLASDHIKNLLTKVPEGSVTFKSHLKGETLKGRTLKNDTLELSLTKSGNSDFYEQLPSGKYLVRDRNGEQNRIVGPNDLIKDIESTLNAVGLMSRDKIGIKSLSK